MNVPTGQYCPPSIGMLAAFNWNPWPGSSESANLRRADRTGRRIVREFLFMPAGDYPQDYMAGSFCTRIEIVISVIK
jgi:hypothetical protein